MKTTIANMFAFGLYRHLFIQHHTIAKPSYFFLLLLSIRDIGFYRLWNQYLPQKNHSNEQKAVRIRFCIDVKRQHFSKFI